VIIARNLEAGHEFRIGRLHRAGPRGAVAHDTIGGIELRPLLQQLLAGAVLVFPQFCALSGAVVSSTCAIEAAPRQMASML
jgi:hypothetical protein